MASSNTAMISKLTSIAASAMLVRSIIYHFLPPHFRHLLLSRLCNFLSRFCNFFSRFSSCLSMVVDEYNGFAVNRLYEAAELYLSTRISPSNTRLKVCKPDMDKGFLVTMDKGQEMVDMFDGVKMTWTFISTEKEKGVTDSRGRSSTRETRCFELSFDKIHRDKVLRAYFPHILDRAKAIKDENTPVRIFTLGRANGLWSSVVLDHPSTFETLAMEETQKAALMNDLKKFVERKQLYRQVGKAWKRGYLLYGPPGTGKSSLIAAMANFLKFDIYDLELTDVRGNSDLRNLLMATSNRSILVIEDIDCTKELKDREGEGDQAIPVHSRWGPFGEKEVTLSGFLNFIDGLWSSCGDERIIVFTTNHKEKLDPALLRPGRMDMHIHMSYCSFPAFRILASKYLGIHDHPLFEHIRDTLQKVQITPAEVGEEFMRSELDNPTAALQRLIDALLKKEREKEEEKEKKEDDEPVEVKESAGDSKEKDEKTEEERKLGGGQKC